MIWQWAGNERVPEWKLGKVLGIMYLQGVKHVWYNLEYYSPELKVLTDRIDDELDGSNWPPHTDMPVEPWIVEELERMEVTCGKL